MKQHIYGWMKPTQTPARVIIRREAYELLWHFVGGIGSCRCQEAGCELCSLHGEPSRTLVHVVEKSGTLHVLELNAAAVERPLIVGDVIVIQRRKLADYAETFIRRDGFEEVKRVEAIAYLAAIGQRSYERAVKAPRKDDWSG